MLGLFGKKKPAKTPIYATQTGTVLVLDDVPDPVFSGRVLGEGIAILPTDGVVYSPVDGEVADVTETGHAVGITTKDGADILVHVGLETVSLKGEGFECLVKPGDAVRVGQPIIRADLDLLREKGLKLHTPTVIPDMEGIELEIVPLTSAEGGKTIVAYYTKQ